MPYPEPCESGPHLSGRPPPDRWSPVVVKRGCWLRLLLLAGPTKAARAVGAAAGSAGFLVETATAGSAGEAQVRQGGHDVIVWDLKAVREEDLGRIACWRRGGVAACVLGLLDKPCGTRAGVGLLNAGADDYLLRP